MPNANTIFRAIGADSPAQGANAIPTFSQGTSTSAQIVTNQLGNAVFLVPMTGAELNQFSATKAGGINFDGMPFRIRLAGRVTTLASVTVTHAIMYASAATTTYTSGNVIATDGGQTVATTSSSFLLEFTGMWDSTSKQLNGTYYGVTNGNLVDLTVKQLTGITTLGGFEIALTCGTASDATWYISEFTIEQV